MIFCLVHPWNQKIIFQLGSWIDGKVAEAEEVVVMAEWTRHLVLAFAKSLV